MNKLSSYIWINTDDSKTYATKNKDITKCFDRAIKQCGHNHIKLEYIVCCDDDYINKLIEEHEAIII